jgi:hypothetical protein
MKTKVDLQKLCSNYFDWLKGSPALDELLSLCCKKGWLRCPTGYYMLFELHYSSKIIYWNRKNLVELVYLFHRLLELKYIKIRKNRGFWSAIEKHLCDFDGNPIKTSLSDLYAEVSKNMTVYDRRTLKVDKVLHLVKRMIKNNPTK